ncbi:PadR family transcriptional regulator [Kocuria arenosa]|uniref:PadR family transcriptional regulator n=1 Tax=Kocuria arenosa TaxID=3071446 RepID=UPI0034D417FC
MPARLERNDLVTVEWRAGEGEPGRKHFALADAGRTELEPGITHPGFPAVVPFRLHLDSHPPTASPA